MASASADPERRLILNCDDLGLAHGVNEAAFEAWERGCLTSASVMAVCPRFDEVVRYGKIHRDLDLGVHLTLTSEWSRYQWGPLADPGRVPSLVDADGFMWPDARAVLEHATLEDVELELTLQIEAVLGAGLTPTHLDSHMFVLLQRRLFPIYEALGRRFSLPILVPLTSGSDPRGIDRDRSRKPVDRYFAAGPAWMPDRWVRHYLDCVDRLVPGVNEIALHLARNGADMKAVEAGHETAGWNGEWRQRDLDVLCGERFQAAIVDAGVTLTTWRISAAASATAGARACS